MKALTLVLLTGTVMLAQTPAPKSAAPKAPAESALMHPETLKAKAPELYRVKFTTTKGDVLIEVHRDWAPNGADRFYNLVKNRFFTDVSFFRVIKGFMSQFGIPPNPKVAAVWNNANIRDDAPKQSNKKGMVTFAQTGQPNSRSTQIFINMADNTFLDSQNFPPFGTVTEGMSVVESFYNEYGEGAPQGRGPDQGRVQQEGKAYLDKSFPKLDSIKSAVLLPADGTAPTAAPAATKSTAAPAKKSTGAVTKSTGAPAVKKSTGAPVVRKSTGAPVVRKSTGAPVVRKSTGAPAVKKSTAAPAAAKK